jgi:hypothetical protein
MKNVWVLGLALALGGCGGLSYAAQEYTGVEVLTVQMPDDNYRVFDKPAENKMMVTSSVGSALAQGAGQGLLLNAIDNTPPKPLFEAAAIAFLAQSGRSSCRIIDAYLIVKPQYEIKYDCTPPPPSPAPAIKRTPANSKR